MDKYESIIDYYVTGFRTDVIFLSSFAIAVVYLIFDGLQRFATDPNDQLDRRDDEGEQSSGALARITSRFFTLQEISARSKWRRGQVVYILFISFLFLFLTPTLTKLLKIPALAGPGLAESDVSHSLMPILAACIIGGILPALPFMRELEKHIRLMAHRIAGIPSDIEDLSERIYYRPLRSFEELADSDPELAEVLDWEELRPDEPLKKQNAYRLRMASRTDDIPAGVSKPNLVRARYLMELIKERSFGSSGTARRVVDKYSKLVENCRVRLEWIEDQLRKPSELDKERVELRLNETAEALAYLLAVQIQSGVADVRMGTKALDTMHFQSKRPDLPQDFVHTVLLSAIRAGFAVLLLGLLSNVTVNLLGVQAVVAPNDMADAVVFALSTTFTIAIPIALLTQIRKRGRAMSRWYQSSRQSGEFGIRYISVYWLVGSIAASVLTMLTVALLIVNPLNAMVANPALDVLLLLRSTFDIEIAAAALLTNLTFVTLIVLFPRLMEIASSNIDAGKQSQLFGQRAILMTALVAVAANTFGYTPYEASYADLAWIVISPAVLVATFLFGIEFDHTARKSFLSRLRSGVGRREGAALPEPYAF